MGDEAKVEPEVPEDFPDHNVGHHRVGALCRIRGWSHYVSPTHKINEKSGRLWPSWVSQRESLPDSFRPIRANWNGSWKLSAATPGGILSRKSTSPKNAGIWPSHEWDFVNLTQNRRETKLYPICAPLKKRPSASRRSTWGGHRAASGVDLQIPMQHYDQLRRSTFSRCVVLLPEKLVRINTELKKRRFFIIGKWW